MTAGSNHYRNVLKPCADIADICRPLSKFSIDFFCYHRIYNDKSEIMLSNKPTWAEHFYKSNFLMDLDFKVINSLNLKYVIWPFSNDIKILTEVRDICNIFSGITLVINDKNYYELFGFGMSKKFDSSYINLAINNIDLLERFCFYFKHQASDIIKNCRASKIFPNTAKSEEVQNINQVNLDHLRKEFFSEVELTKFLIKNRITPKEISCINYLLLGNTAREIADALYVSPRTVETHLANIKSKLNCHTKSELISYLIKNGFNVLLSDAR